ncbi:unnamed protein product [Ambrosiozyma monospora]|uniref:Unnamed protein product n=1 Tax=Ambrosiozyma monospora TaxID=43982 RepID=A0ACB5U267_AMBMO|nr:unnamed protein product [Ambrosiozyma monospora]
MKFAFWEEQIDKCEMLEQDPNSPKVLTGEPATTLLSDSIRNGVNINLETLRQMVKSHQYFLKNESKKGFDTVENICSFGEGTNSQVNYAIQSALLSPSLKEFSDFSIRLLELPESNDIRNNLSDISAHLGQATSVCSFVIALRYFVDTKGQLMLPLDILIKNKIPQEDVLRLIKNGQTGTPEVKDALKNAIFETCTTANDHILTARSKFDSLKQQINDVVKNSNDARLISHLKALNHGVPDCMFLPFMNGIPTILYLERLEKYDFDVLNPNLQFKEWRLAWRAFRSHRGRFF